ncbi:MAG TPA: cupredoxin domain-containing protein [Actinomycetota bacterium]
MRRRLQGTARGVIAALAALALAACGAEASGDVHPGPGGPDAVAVVARDNTFEPAWLELPAGQDVEVEITNEGGTMHDFTVESLDLSTGPIEEGAVATASLTVPAGETTFACSIHGGMDGVIVGT